MINLKKVKMPKPSKNPAMDQAPDQIPEISQVRPKPFRPGSSFMTGFKNPMPNSGGVANAIGAARDLISEGFKGGKFGSLKDKLRGNLPPMGENTVPPKGIDKVMGSMPSVTSTPQESINKVTDALGGGQLSANKKRPQPNLPEMNEDERAMKMSEALDKGNTDEYYRLQGLTPPTLRPKPMPFRPPALGGGLRKPAIVSPAQQFQDMQNQLIQKATQNDMQQPPAQQAPASPLEKPEMQSAMPQENAPEQQAMGGEDDAALDQQISQLQQQIEALRSRKKGV